MSEDELAKLFHDGPPTAHDRVLAQLIEQAEVRANELADWLEESQIALGVAATALAESEAESLKLFKTLKSLTGLVVDQSGVGIAVVDVQQFLASMRTAIAVVKEIESEESTPLEGS